VYLPRDVGRQKGKKLSKGGDEMVDMAQGSHTTDTPYTRKPHSSVPGEGWARKRVDYHTSAASTEARSFSQAPPFPVLPLCTGALGIIVSY
jgi:hypothetical protein